MSDRRPERADPTAEGGVLDVSVERAVAPHFATRGAEADRVALEEPLEMRIQGRPLAVTMRTPGDDRELVLGFLYAEGVIRSRAEVVGLETEPGPDGLRMLVELAEPALDRWARHRIERETRMTSACGVCGKPTLEDLHVDHLPIAPVPWESRLIPTLLARMRERQHLFARTGGVHAAAAFEADGTLCEVFEDVGRHNAVDKVVGAMIERERPLAERLLVVSGRAGFEIVQKALVAGASAVIAVGAATSLAVELALEGGLELWVFAGERGATRVRGAGS